MNKKVARYIAWKEEPYEEKVFTSSDDLMMFLHIGETTLDKMLDEDIAKNGWKCEKLIVPHSRTTAKPHKQIKTLKESVEAVDQFLRGSK